MKKALSIILVFILCLALCACGSGNTNTTTESTVSTTTAPSTTVTHETPQLACYPGTNFPKIESVIEKLKPEPVIEEDLCTRYRYEHKFYFDTDYHDYMGLNGDYQKFFKSYKNDILSQFEQKTYYYKVDDTRSYNYTVWFDGAGNALIQEGSFNYVRYHLDMCIISEDNVQAYIDSIN